MDDHPVIHLFVTFVFFPYFEKLTRQHWTNYCLPLQGRGAQTPAQEPFAVLGDPQSGLWEAPVFNETLVKDLLESKVA